MSKEENCEIVPDRCRTGIESGFRILLAAVPVAGPLLQAWSEYTTRKKDLRIEDFFRNLAEELKTLKGRISSFEDALSNCPDSPELFEMTVDRVRKEYGESKRKVYAQVLARLLVSGNGHTHEERVALLESLDLLSEMDLRVLLLFKEEEKVEIGNLDWRSLGLRGDDVNEQLWELACHLAKLESRGLILKTSFNSGSAVYVPQEMEPDTARWVKTKYRLLSLGKSLIVLLKVETSA